MRVVFLGSPAFALPSLAALLASGQEVVAVVTQPDRPAGRGRQPSPPPVKTFAERAGLTVLQPEKVSAPESVEQLRALTPEVLVIAAYGQILRQAVLDVPRRGSLNVHASLLPRHRGASPIAAALLAGEDRTGVTIMEVVRALDAGPMVARVEEPILPADTTGSLEARLAEAGGRLLAQTLEPWAREEIKPQPQDESLATYAPLLKREDARIDWSRPAVDIWRQVRAYNPWPVAFTEWKGQELRVLEAYPIAGVGDGEAGTVIGERNLPEEASAGAKAPAVQTREGLLALLRLQLPGKKPVTGAEFVRGQRDFVGSRLGGG
jgi:methionyl-tRNA formyltransferase